MQPSATTADPATQALQSSTDTGAAAATTTNPAAGTTTPAAAPAVALPSVPKYNYSDNVDSGTALQDLTNFQTNEKSAVDIYNEATTSLGIPDVRTNVTNLRKQIADTTALLNALPDSVTGRTSGSLVTEAQRSRILGMERAPLDQANQQYSNNYNMESQNLNDLTAQATQQSQLYSSDQDRITNALQSRLTNIQQAEAEKQRQAEAQRQYDLQIKQLDQQISDANRTYNLALQQLAETQRQFNVGQAAAADAKPSRSEYNVELSNLENTLRGFQASGYKDASKLPTASSIKNALISTYRGIISASEINGYVDTLYKRYYLTPN